jgi:hypothetical protein
MMLLLVFVIPTLIVSMWSIFIPVYLEMKRRKPQSSIVRFKLTYFITCTVLSIVLAPIMFYIVILGDCSQFRYKLMVEIIKSEHYNK